MSPSIDFNTHWSSESKHHPHFVSDETAADACPVGAFDDAISAPAHPELWSVAQRVIVTLSQVACAPGCACPASHAFIISNVRNSWVRSITSLAADLNICPRKLGFESQRGGRTSQDTMLRYE